MPNPIARRLGELAVFTSAFCFYFSTVVIRWSQTAVTIDPSFFAFFRFVLGFLVVAGVMIVQRQPPQPRNYHLLIGRTVANCVAVYCFYQAVKHTSVAEANILNMTYPVFVALLSWILLRQQRDPLAVAMVVIAFGGIWLILAPGKMAFGLSSLWGLASGVAASGAIIYLNVSRRYHDTNTVLFFMFGLGALVMWVGFHRHIFLPGREELFYLFLCGAGGVAGQFLLTIGFRYVSAVEGSILSALRILLAALLGPVLAAEPALGLSGWIGALLLFGANEVLALRRPTVG